MRHKLTWAKNCWFSDTTTAGSFLLGRQIQYKKRVQVWIPRSYGTNTKLLCIVTWACVFQGEVFICKFVSIDALSTSTITACEIPSLAHKLRNNSMETGASKSKTFLISAKGTEIFYKNKKRKTYIFK